MHYQLFPFILPQPIVPTIDAHDGVIEIDRCLSQQLAFKTEINIKDGIDENQWVEEQIFSVVDTKRLKDLVAAFKPVVELKQVLIGFISKDKQEQIDIQKELLEINKAKSGMFEDEEDTYKIVEIPSIDYSEYDKEQQRLIEEYRKKEDKKNENR